MSIQASVRAAYRDLYRAASKTFAGDAVILSEFRRRMRADILLLSTTSQSDADAEKYIAATRDTAKFVRRNLVQATNVQDNLWRLRITSDTELGDNDTIKVSSSATGSSQGPFSDAALPTDRQRVNFSTLKKARQHRIVPVLNENDLEERFVRGSGPGGQSINKTENKVQLLHKPTNLRVSCQETRSLEQNRKIARRKLISLLDELQNPGMSREAYLKARSHERGRQKRKKARKKAERRAQETGL